ncbi:MAG: succinyl-diaminopimelate desuccinylase [Hyphomicrobiales bacterium]|nr:succinyl-diaminopimelate desuccinylase [Hyphomicrobiales bacterium]
MIIDNEPTGILQSLIRCASVTPDEGGALDYLQSLLEPHGFVCTRLPFSDDGTPDVDNLFARLGDGGRHLCFAGHTDVVPPGDEASWTIPPFAGEIVDGVVYGRGACDMKGSVAAFASAAIDYAASCNGKLPGSISLLITGDEEGPAINGTVKVLEWLRSNGQVPDHAVVGEPTCPEELGDTIKVGRRGSIHFEVTVTGVQGHSAYPQKADNPIPKLARLIDAVTSVALDDGAENFDPSTLSVSTFDVANPANNVIPEKAVARFNVRYNTVHSPDSLTRWVHAACDKVAQELGGRFDVQTIEAADCFYTGPGPLADIVGAAIQAETGLQPELSTGGGTSDARFIKDYCPVVEFGPINQTIHQVDERIGVEELKGLTRIYRGMLERYFAGTGE